MTMFDSRSNMQNFYHNLEKEINSLQLVDYIFSCIEKARQIEVEEKFEPSRVKTVLKEISKALQSGNEAELSELEKKIEEEVESWCLSLSWRDKKIAPSDLRLHCENSKPPLSPQALLALIRFYVGVPFSEPVRAKLDVLVTRLFTSELWDGSRVLTLSAQEIKAKLESFYREWANVPLFSEQKIDVSDEFIKFVEKAKRIDSLDELLGSGLHVDLLDFKKSLGEDFLEPSVLASAVNCNVSFGNRCVELILQEKARLGAEVVKSKYSSSMEVLSETVAKTIVVSEIVDAKEPVKAEIPVKMETLEQIESGARLRKESVSKSKEREGNFLNLDLSFRVTNKWLIITLLLTIGLAVGLYVYVELGTSGVTRQNVEVFQIENTEFQGYLRAGRISNELLIGVVTDKWKSLNEGEKRMMLEKLLGTGKQKNFRKVFLLNNDGLTVAEASEKSIEIYDR